MNISSTNPNHNYQTQNNTTKMQEALSEIFTDNANVKEEDKTGLKVNIFTGEFYNFKDIYSSIEDFKKDITQRSFCKR